MRVVLGSFKVRNKLFSSRDQDSASKEAIGRPSLRLILLGSIRRAATKIPAHSRQMKARYTAGGTPDEEVLRYNNPLACAITEKRMSYLTQQQNPEHSKSTSSRCRSPFQTQSGSTCRCILTEVSYAYRIDIVPPMCMHFMS